MRLPRMSTAAALTAGIARAGAIPVAPGGPPIERRRIHG